MNIKRYPKPKITKARKPKPEPIDPDEPQRTLSVGELIEALSKLNHSMPVSSQGAWIIGVEVGHEGYADLGKRKEKFVELVRYL